MTETEQSTGDRPNGTGQAGAPPGFYGFVVFAILGAINWIARWYRPDGASEWSSVGDQFADVFLQGLVT